jgi:hypothetical protein
MQCGILGDGTMGNMEIEIRDLREASCDKADLALVDVTFTIQFLMANELTPMGLYLGGECCTHSKVPVLIS